MNYLQHGQVSFLILFVGSVFVVFFTSKFPGDHGYIVEEINRAVLEVKSILSVSEVQVYYRDSGLIAAKVDIVLPATLTISDAHIIAGES